MMVRSLSARIKIPVTDKIGTLNGKVILVTGAGKGLGSILSRELAAHGASLAINDLTPINLDQVEAQILAESGIVRSYIVDVSKKILVCSPLCSLTGG